MSETETAGSPIGVLPGWWTALRSVVLGRCATTQIEVIPRHDGKLIIIREDGQENFRMLLPAEAATCLARLLAA